jgi:hypothetical protein
MNFSGKCYVLSQLWSFHRFDENTTWKEFFEWADLGLPMAYLANKGYVKVTPNGEFLVDEIWTVFCNLIEIDPDGKYVDLEAAFAASDHPAL